jgi:hypothetical protein
MEESTSMKLQFRKVNQASYPKLVSFLTSDVERSGGSAGEVVDMHGMLVLVQVCKVPSGTLLLRREVSKLEALAWVSSDD